MMMRDASRRSRLLRPVPEGGNAKFRKPLIRWRPSSADLIPTCRMRIRTLVAHRGVTVESFLADVLMAFALDVVDETWRRVTGAGNRPLRMPKRERLAI